MRLYIHGAGGHGKVALSAARALNIRVEGFIDDSLKGETLGLPSFNRDSVALASDVSVHVAIGDNRVRRKLQMEWCARGVGVQSIIHPRSFLYDGVRINSGGLILPNALVGPSVSLGVGCIVNHSAIVDHDTVIESFCHIAPGAIIGGGVTIGNLCLIGSGAVIQPGITIGDEVIIGSGAVVTHDLDSGSVVVGNPAKLIDRRIS
jgi:sugar O-acyltransferase (sialic acid O-acetyltransferase NeuD family)